MWITRGGNWPDFESGPAMDWPSVMFSRACSTAFASRVFPTRFLEIARAFRIGTPEPSRVAIVEVNR